MMWFLSYEKMQLFVRFSSSICITTFMIYGTIVEKVISNYINDHISK